jgi:hypothetical protein
MAGMTTMPRTRSNKFVVHTYDADRHNQVAKYLNLDKLMTLHGEKAIDYTDLTQIAKRQAFSKLGKTLSKFKAPFSDMVQGMGGVKDIDTNWVQWRVYGDPDFRCMMHGDSNDPSIDHLGIGGLPFEVWVDHDFYSALDVLAPIHNKSFEMVVQSDYATPYKGGFVYQVVLKDSDPASEFDRIYFQAGEYLIKMGSLQSWEEIGSFGSIQLGETFSYLEYRVPLTTMGWKFEVQGEAHRRSKSIAVVGCDDIQIDGNGNKIPMGIKSAGITNYIETKARMQIDMEKELAMIYGRSSRNMIDPKTLKEITTSPGLMEWFEYGQEVPYNPKVNSLDYIAEMFEGLWEDRLETDQWDVELLTGKAGMKLFSTWIAEKFGDMATVTNYDFVLKETTPFDNNYSRDGYAFTPPQFTQYVLPGYGRVRVAHWPLLDDQKINGVRYPGSQHPVSSYEFIAINGAGFGEPNVQKLVRTDNRYTGYQCGFWSPWGAVNQDNPFVSNPHVDIGDRYHYFHRESFGLLVMDPELLIRFRPTIE